MALTIKSLIARAEGPVTAPVGNELVMADVDAGKYYGFDEVAAAIWQGMDKQTTVEDLCRTLQTQYDVTEERCRTEVLAFLEKLEERGLIRVS